MLNIFFKTIGVLGFSCIMYLGHKEMFHALQLTFNGLKTNGRIVNFELNDNAQFKTKKYPQIEYITSTNQRLIFVEKSYFGEWEKGRGSTVPLIYLPKIPTIVKRNEFYARWGSFLFYLFWSLFFLFMMLQEERVDRSSTKTKENLPPIPDSRPNELAIKEKIAGNLRKREDKVMIDYEKLMKKGKKQKAQLIEIKTKKTSEGRVAGYYLVFIYRDKKNRPVRAETQVFSKNPKEFVKTNHPYNIYVDVKNPTEVAIELESIFQVLKKSVA